MKSFLRSFYFHSALPAILALALMPGHILADDSFLYKDIANAIQIRNIYFSNVGISPEMARTGLKDPSEIAKVLRILEERAEPENVWYNFLWAITKAESSEKDAREGFELALAATQADPATDWVLFIEFARYGQDAWAGKALEQMERNLLRQGAVAVPAISQHLLHQAVDYEHQGRGAESDKMLNWVRLMDPLSVWPALRTIRQGFFFNPAKFSAGLNELIRLGTGSWQVQLVLLENIRYALSLMAFFFVAGLLFVLILKYAGKATHGFAEALPDSLPLAVRAMLALALAGILAGLGMLLFFWFCIFILWQYLSKSEKQLAGFAALLVALAPLSYQAQELILNCRSADSSCTYLSRSLYEGYSEDLEKAIVERLARHADDNLARTAAAIVYLKKNDFPQSLAYIQGAEIKAPNDPVVLMTSGVVYRHNNMNIQARQAFSKCAAAYPTLPEGLYDLGQFQMSTQEALDGSELIARATRLSGDKINIFIEKNDRYYSNDWPSLRQFIIGDYPPGYFWRNIFPVYCRVGNGNASAWGVRLFGVSALWSAAAFFVLWVILIFTNGLAGSAIRVKKVSDCQVCGAPMCRKCSNGLYCGKCLNKLNSIRAADQKLALKNRIILNRRKSGSLLTALLTILFPGVGMVYAGKGKFLAPFVLLILTSGVYAAYFSSYFASFSYPWKIALDMMIMLLVPCAGYSIIFIILAFMDLKKARAEAAK